MRVLQRICFWVCVLCIVAAIPLALTLIWGDADRYQTIGRVLLTLLVFVAAAGSILSVIQLVLGRAGDKSTP